MGISVRTYVFCDCCGDGFLGLVAPRRQALKSRTLARHVGWARKLNEATGEHEDICPGCQEQAQEDGGGDGS